MKRNKKRKLSQVVVLFFASMAVWFLIGPDYNQAAPVYLASVFGATLGFVITGLVIVTLPAAVSRYKNGFWPDWHIWAAVPIIVIHMYLAYTGHTYEEKEDQHKAQHSNEAQETSEGDWEIVETRPLTAEERETLGERYQPGPEELGEDPIAAYQKMLEAELDAREAAQARAKHRTWHGYLWEGGKSVPRGIGVFLGATLCFSQDQLDTMFGHMGYDIERSVTEGPLHKLGQNVTDISQRVWPLGGNYADVRLVQIIGVILGGTFVLFIWWCYKRFKTSKTRRQSAL
ncbi:hypothetical protein J2T60_002443 [Natronospira proteinivora]|uniref:Uncharacterized protein n=1 Tax=Natronospira proteinivora TaxID=1807133 RepID=A0ABT1GAU7_9GAMM|nr:hypothetical protein [Natronospira proteinivora]MCP1728443.1 hypothetical protein [Natronospira proteinivora]